MEKGNEALAEVGPFEELTDADLEQMNEEQLEDGLRRSVVEAEKKVGLMLLKKQRYMMTNYHQWRKLRRESKMLRQNWLHQLKEKRSTKATCGLQFLS